MGEPFGTPPPPGPSEGVQSDYDSSLPSEWVTGTLRDCWLYQEFISQVETLRQTVWSAFEALIAVLEAIIALFDAIKALLQLLDDLVTTAIKLIVETLQALKDLLIQWLSDMLGMGFYFFPHFMKYDWARVITDTLLNPYGVSYGHTGVAPTRNPVVPTMRAFPDPTAPGKFQYRLVQKSGRRGVGVDQFLEDLANSFENPRDKLRPIFSSSVGVSGVVVVLGFNDVFALLRLIVWLMDLIDKNGNYGVRMASFIRDRTAEALGQAYAQGTGTPEAIEAAQRFLEDCNGNNVVESLITGVEGHDSTNGVTDRITIQALDENDSDGRTTGSLAVLGHLGDAASLADTAKKDVFAVLNRGVDDAYLGSYRANVFSYQAAQQVSGGTCRLFVQRMDGLNSAYRSTKRFSASEHGVLSEFDGLPRGIMIQETNSQKNGTFYCPIAAGADIDLDGPMFPKNQAVGVFESRPDYAARVFGDVDPTGSGYQKGDWYINVRTRVVRAYNGSNWYTAATPNVLIFSSWNAEDDTLVAGPVCIYVLRFRQPDEAILVEDYSTSPPTKGYATYQYNDNWQASGRCEASISWAMRAKAAANLGVPVSRFESSAGLPKRAGGGGGTLDMTLFSWPDIMVEETKLPLDLEVSFTAPASVAQGSWWLIRNHQRLARMDGDTFSEMELTGFLNRISHDGAKTIVSIQNEKLEEGVTALEVAASSITETLPVGPGGGNSLYAITMTTYSRPITYNVKRDEPTPTGGVRILSPKTVVPNSLDGDFRNQIMALGSAFTVGWEDLTSADEWKGFFDQPDNQFLGKYYWRGFKPVGAGVLIYDINDPERVKVFEPSTAGIFSAKDTEEPMVLPVGVHNFRVYSFNYAWYTGVGGSIAAIKEKLRAGTIPENMHRAGMLSTARDWTVVVDDQIDPRDIPGKHAWQTISMKRWFDVVEPLDAFLQSLIDAIPIPPSIFQWLVDWIERIQRRIEYWESILRDIQEWIDRLLRIFDIGDTGFYFLGVNGAAGSNGFINRVQKVDVPAELEGLPYATGFCMLAPDNAGGSLMMEILFDWLPQQRLPGEEGPGGYPSPWDIIAEKYSKISEQVQETLEKSSEIVDRSAADFTEDMDKVRTGIKNMSQRDFQKLYPEDE